MTDDDQCTDDEITGPIEVKRHGPDKPRTAVTPGCGCYTVRATDSSSQGTCRASTGP